MLLETKNISKNGFIIFSRNSMDVNYNFRIVFKNDPKLFHRKINFDYTKKLITEIFPKNLVAYRVLTNNPDISISALKYSCTILVNGKPELIFTDPVFAVRSIEEYLEVNQNDDFRFRIQKVGYSMTNKAGKIASYQEEFLYDLNAEQAINQNDELNFKSLFPGNKRTKHIDNSIDENKRDIIFAPEKPKEINDHPDNKLSYTLVPGRRKRANRFVEGNSLNAVKKLYLSGSPNYRVENKFVKRLSLNENVVKNISRKMQSEIRNDQIKFRGNKSVDRVVFDNETKYELLSKITEDKESTNMKFRRVQSIPALDSHEVQIDEDGVVEQVESISPEIKNDDLFSKFLQDLQGEGNLKIKKKNKQKRKERESVIFQLFKSGNGKI